MIVASVSASRNGPYKLAPGTTPKKLQAFGPLAEEDNGFFAVVMSIANLFFAFGAYPSYLPLMAELHAPSQDFPKALATLLAIQTTLYLVMTGVVLHSMGEVRTGYEILDANEAHLVFSFHLSTSHHPSLRA